MRWGESQVLMWRPTFGLIQSSWGATKNPSSTTTGLRGVKWKKKKSILAPKQAHHVHINYATVNSIFSQALLEHEQPSTPSREVNNGGKWVNCTALLPMKGHWWVWRLLRVQARHSFCPLESIWSFSLSDIRWLNRMEARVDQTRIFIFSDINVLSVCRQKGTCAMNKVNMENLVYCFFLYFFFFFLLFHWNASM